MCSDLDKRLAALFEADWDEEFAKFVGDIVRRYPVPENLYEAANRYADMLDNALILFSGYGSEEYPEFAAVAEKMKKVELSGEKWALGMTDESALADLIAHKALEALVQGHASVLNPEQVYLAIGLYTYAVVARGEGLDEFSFRRIFVEAWFRYFGEVLPSCVDPTSTRPEVVS